MECTGDVYLKKETGFDAVHSSDRRACVLQYFITASVMDQCACRTESIKQLTDSTCTACKRSAALPEVTFTGGKALCPKKSGTSMC